jgi:hypothetical protein
MTDTTTTTAFPEKFPCDRGHFECSTIEGAPCQDAAPTFDYASSVGFSFRSMIDPELEWRDMTAERE